MENFQNKWDLIEKEKNTMKEMKEYLLGELPFLSYAPIEFISALTGQRTTRLFGIAEKIYEEYIRRISTGLLNTVINEAVIMNPPPTRKGRVTKVNYATQEAVIMNPPPTRKGRVTKVNYATQIATAPPRFVLFCNYPELMHFSYARYIENKLREAFGFEGSPLLQDLFCSVTIQNLCTSLMQDILKINLEKHLDLKVHR